VRVPLRPLFRAACLLSILGSAACAYADPVINGNVYFEGVDPTGPNQGVVPAQPISAPSANFTVSGFNFNVPSNGNGTLLGFLNSGGQLLTFQCVYDSNCGNQNNLGLLYQFTGETELTAGTTYSFTHDDGVRVYLDGVEVISSPNPTYATTDSFSVAASGDYSFEVLYTNVNAFPAVLTSNVTPVNVPVAATPEPSSFLLLGSGLLAAAAGLKRRLA
jgi:hypothetical protein